MYQNVWWMHVQWMMFCLVNQLLWLSSCYLRRTIFNYITGQGGSSFAWPMCWAPPPPPVILASLRACTSAKMSQYPEPCKADGNQQTKLKRDLLFFSVCPHPTQDPKLVVTTKATTTSSAVTKPPTSIRGKSQLSTLRPGPTDGAQFTDRTVGTTNVTPVG